jgi:hypothetical protein
VDLLGVSSYFPWFKVNRSNPKDCKGDDEKKRGGKKPRKEKKSKILAKKKKTRKKISKEAKLPILFWSFVGLLFWSLLVKLLTSHRLAFVVLFKTHANFSP